MRLLKERRQSQAWRLRVYIDALNQAEATSPQEWIDQWARCADANAVFISRTQWIDILKRWALVEAGKMADKRAA